jgi:hypothetical protein
VVNTLQLSFEKGGSRKRRGSSHLDDKPPTRPGFMLSIAWYVTPLAFQSASASPSGVVVEKWIPRSALRSPAGRFHPQFRDKNRRDISKSQSK